MSPQTFAGRLYALAIAPFLLGSAFFFYWIYQRYFNAFDVDVEVLAAFAILFFVLAVVIVLIASVVFIVRYRSHWQMLIPVFVSLAITVPAIITYAMCYDEIDNHKAFLKIVNDKKMEFSNARVWSNHADEYGFESDGDHLIVWYNPGYTYNGKYIDSFGPQYDISDVYITLKLPHAEKTFVLPQLEKGSCSTINLSELDNYIPKKRK